MSELAAPPSNPRRLVYLGTPELAVTPLLALHRAGFDLPLVVSQPDRRRGRGATPAPTPVKAAALELGLRVSDDIDDVLDVDADLGVVVAFGRLIKPHVLARLPMVNLHFSLLPRWRGAAPVERALLAGDPITGVCLMQVVEELDAGGIYRTAEVPIPDDATVDSLRGRLVAIGTDLLVSALTEGLGRPVPQVGEPVYAHKIESGGLRLDFSRPAVELDRVVRLGGAWTQFRSRRLRIWQVEPVENGPGIGELAEGVVGTSAGGLRLVEVQPEGRQRMAADAWMNGARPLPGERLG